MHMHTHEDTKRIVYAHLPGTFVSDDLTFTLDSILQYDYNTINDITSLPDLAAIFVEARVTVRQVLVFSCSEGHNLHALEHVL